MKKDSIPGALPPETEGGDWGLIARSPLRVLALTIAVIAIVEYLVMMVIERLPPMPHWMDNILDAVLLTAICFPILYFAIFRRFVLQLDKSHVRELALRDSERRLRQLVDSGVDAIIRMDSRGVIAGWNASAEAIFGWSAAEVMGRRLSEVIIPEGDRQGHENGLARFLATGESKRLNCRIESRGLHRGGREFPIELAIAAVETAEGHLFTAFVHDISARKDTDKRLLLAGKVFENSGEAIMVTDANNDVLSVNPAFCQITGYGAQEVIGRNPRLLRSDEHDDAFYKAMWASINDTGKWRGEIWNRRKNGELFLEWLSIVRIGDGVSPETNFMATFSDITDRREAAQRIEHLAHHDQLTGLPNRTLLQSRMQGDLAAARRDQRQMAVLFLDVEKFKPMVEKFGRAVGDALLRAVAERLVESVRPDDTVSRIGEDEFVILLSVIADATVSEDVAAKIVAAMAQPFEIDGLPIEARACVGVALFPDHDFDGAELIKCAEIAMRQVREQGGGGYRVFSPSR